MMKGNFRILAVKACLILFLLFPGLAVRSQSVATLTGTVFNEITGTPVTGAKISVDGHFTYSVLGGLYILNISPPGTFPVSCSKPGFDNFLSAPVTFQASFTYPMDISLRETRNPAGSVTVNLDTTGLSPVVPIQWQIPQGTYDLIYDDGVQDNFTVWAVQGNMNALRVTPLGYPARVIGGMVNIGNSSNYPTGSTPFVPFQVSVCDATGPGGNPGAVIAGPLVVIPSAFGWLDFTFPVPPVVNAGDFYLVMTQGGNAPNASGLAVDETSPAFRSFSRFVTGGGDWLPAAGNFLIRALVEGPGGPSLQKKAPGSAIGYNLWRLKQGEEMNSAVWTSLGTTTLTHQVDSSWNLLPCGPYRWGVKAIYPANRFSPVTFSNVLGKCWTINVNVHVTLSCDSADEAGTKVAFTNLVYPDTLYNKLVDFSGNAGFPQLWKGAYELKVTRFGYVSSVQNLSLNTDTLIEVFLLQEKTAPSGLVVHDTSLLATWNKPNPVREIFRETWESGNFSTNEWTLQGGVNWVISSTAGNPQPSAMFNWSPPAVNYEQSLQSKIIAGINSPLMKLKFDIFLDSHGTTTLNQMAVELWDGSAWHLLKNYTNATGDIQWTSQELDISNYTNTNFRIRFKAYGGDSYDINNWNVDNIEVLGSEKPSVSGACVLGYKFYLDNILCSFTQDTSYTIPPNLVQYGGSYQACVTAVYGSGPSGETCVPFVSKFLYPPVNLQGTGIENAAYLSWNMPQTLKSSLSPPPGLMGYIIYRDGLVLDSVSSPDTLSHYDYNLFPGTYAYGVSAMYDLTSYGFPGRMAQSLPAGPVDVVIEYGHLLPFYEPWNSGDFSFNSWVFSPDQGNWKIDTENGNPAPSAEFSGEPERTDYSYAMETPVINATGISCSKIWLDFDDRLMDNSGSSSEKLSVELYYNDNWNLVFEAQNTGSRGWTPRHIDITPVRGKAFRLRFLARGFASLNIERWEIDNINVYAVCKPPEDLAGEAIALDVRLTWTPPVCTEGHPLNEGFEGEQFPPGGWSRWITNQAASWKHIDQNSPVGVHTGNYAAMVSSDYNHQDEWLIAEDIEISGDLTFWSFCYPGSVHNDHYYVKLSGNHGASWELLLDLSTLPPYPSVSGYNQWNEPYTIDLDAYQGQVVDLAWQLVDGDGQGAWYTWAIDDCKVGEGILLKLKPAANPLKFDVYRQDAGAGPFIRVNPAPVYDTTYLDPNLVPSSYAYYVTSVTDNCQSGTPSDTVVVDVITGKNELISPSQLKVFPNPVKNRLNLEADSKIRSVEILDSWGRIVNNFENINNQKVELKFDDFSPGLYLLRTLTDSGIVTSRVVVKR